MEKETKGYLTRKEAAEYLRICVDLLDEARRCQEIEYIQYGNSGRVFFTRGALDQFAARNTVPAKPHYSRSKKCS